MKSTFLLLILLAFAGTSLSQIPPPADENTAGVGLALGTAEDGAIFVSKVMPESPSAASKQIKEGDRILAVGQGEEPSVSLTGKKIEDCVLMVRGAAGSRVRLTICPEGAPATQARDVLLTRDDLLNPLGLALDATLLKVGSDAPELRYITLGDGKAATLSETFAGKLVVVQFWATWSEPCQHAVTEMQKIAAAHAREKDKLAFLTICIDGDTTASAPGNLEKVKAHAQRKQWTQTINAWASVEGRNDWYIGAVPMIYVIGADKKVLEADPMLSKLSALLTSALQKH